MLSERYDLNQPKGISVIPVEASLSRRMLLEMESAAMRRSLTRAVSVL